MERLNDILGQSVQRRQRPHEQRSRPQTTQQPQRQPQVAPNEPRRVMHEQTGRLGQPGYNNQRLPSAGQGTRAFREQADTPIPADYEGRHYGAKSVRRQHNPQRPPTNSATPYQQTTRYPQEGQRTQNRPPQSLPDYHYTDDYAPSLPADVIDDYDEFEDDETGMRYGDWEQDGHEVLIYQRGDAEVSALPPATYSSSLREIQPNEDEEMRPHATRDLRELRMPVSTQPPALTGPGVPTPEQRAQEVQRIRRVTQPLNPRAVAHVNRDRDIRYSSQQEQSGTRPGTQHLPARQSERALALPPAAPRGLCAKCKGAGYLRQDVPFGHPGFGKLVECECKIAEKREKRRRQLRDMSNMDAFRKQTFGSFNPRVPGVQEAYQVAIEYARSPRGWLLLIGPNGSGKTHLAAAIANQSVESECVVLFAVVPDLLDHLRAAFAPNASEVYDQLFSKMREAEVLVLDDLGSQQSSTWANEKLFQLLNYRYNMGMPTVITANQRGLQGIDERISSRLTDVSIVTRVHLDRARDYRPHHPGRRI
jgi:DNA replication protein DnaC